MLRFLVALLLVSGTAAAQELPDTARMAGRYVLQAMESFAEIDLLPDGTFRYGLTAGDLDERARGRWSAEGSRVRLETVPAPRPAVAAPDLPPAPSMARPGEACDDAAGMPKDAVVSTPDASLLDGSGVRGTAALERVVGACGEAERAEPREGRYRHRRGLAFYLLHRRAEAAAEFQRARELGYPGGDDMVAEGLLFGTRANA